MSFLPAFILVSFCLTQFLACGAPNNQKQSSANRQEAADSGPVESKCLRKAAVVDLEKFKTKDRQSQGTVEDNTGIILEMQPLNIKYPHPSSNFNSRMTIWFNGKQVKEVDTPGWFTGYVRYEQGADKYIIIEDFSGGAHCCVSQHILFISGSPKSVKYLGDIGVGHGDPGWYGERVLCKDGKNYLKIPDWRFAYFYTGFAQSFPFIKFYLLTPEGFQLDNKSFRDFYLKELSEIDLRIKKELSRRPEKPLSIISGEDKEAQLTDDLAVLLVERTVNLFCAKDETKAWEDFKSDVQKYYRSTKGVAYLKLQIMKEMARKPY